MAWWAQYKKYFPVIICHPFCSVQNFIFFFKEPWLSLKKERKKLLLHVQNCQAHCISNINKCISADNLDKFIAIWYKNFSCLLLVQAICISILKYSFYLHNFKFSCISSTTYMVEDCPGKRWKEKKNVKKLKLPSH